MAGLIGMKLRADRQAVRVGPDVRSRGKVWVGVRVMVVVVVIVVVLVPLHGCR